MADSLKAEGAENGRLEDYGPDVLADGRREKTKAINLKHEKPEIKQAWLSKAKPAQALSAAEKARAGLDMNAGSPSWHGTRCQATGQLTEGRPRGNLTAMACGGLSRQDLLRGALSCARPLKAHKR
jgi:hypothetical protein